MSTSSANTNAGPAAAASGTVPTQKPKASDEFWYAVWVFAFLIVMAFAAIWIFVPDGYTRLVGAEAPAVVYHVRDCGADADGYETYQNTFIYQDVQGQLQESTSGNECSSAFDTGDVVTIWYRPNDPGYTYLLPGGVNVIIFYILAPIFLVAFLASPGFFLYRLWVLIKACMQRESFARLWLAILACLVMLVLLVVSLFIWPPPTNVLQGSGPTRNYHPGETVSVDGRWTVTVQGAQVAQAGSAHAPDAAGTTCLELDITLRNITHQPLALDLNQFTLYDAQPKALTASCSIDATRLANATLAPGAVVKGALAYRVPASLRQCYLAFRPGTFEENVGRFFWRLKVTPTGRASST